MKKVLFLCLLSLLAVPAFAEWVLIDRIQSQSTTAITFPATDFTSTYADYIFVIDSLESTGDMADIVMQIGVGPMPTWVSSYNGGLSCFQPGDTGLTYNGVSYMGIPLTNISYGGDCFVGDVRMTNAISGLNYGVPVVYGTGLLANTTTPADPCFAMVYATFNGVSTITSVQFVSANPSYPNFSGSVTLYGLVEF